MRPEGTQFARDAKRQRGEERRSVRHGQLARQSKDTVAAAATGEHAEVDLLTDRIPLARKARRQGLLDSPRHKEDAWLHARATRRRARSSSPKTRSGAYSATDPAAAPRRRSRRESSPKYRRTASPSAAVSPGATSNPFTSLRTTSATPPASIASTGVPTDSASTTVCGKFSHLEERIVASAA